MKEVYKYIGKLLSYAKQKLELDGRNEFYARNTVLDIVGLESWDESAADCPYGGESVTALLGGLIGACVKEGLFAEEESERVADAVMGALMLSPKEVNDKFAEILRCCSLANEPNSAATDWLYRYSVASDYVKKEKLDANPRFTAANGLIVTINRSKPEFRDPKKAASGNSTKGGYPKCTICRENEGFSGRSKRTLRTVSLKLGGEDWFWQFSPYGYFYQHGIAVNCKHTPMHVDKDTFYKLMDFVDRFPHWFIGCNAPLPRIGGSVLAHDHFQGGGEKLPLMEAPVAVLMHHKDFPDAEIGVLNWYGTAVRIVSKNRDTVAALSELVRKGWVTYEDKARCIIPEDADGVHSAISPTVFKTERGYEMNIILRNNITTAEFPDGIFHSHPEFHIIKKESVGLIEAQGLFILPGRLAEQFEAIKKVLVSGGELPEELADFRMLFDEMKAMRKTFTQDEAEEAVKRELGDVCERILKNTAVFKTHDETAEFMRRLGFYA